MKTHALIALLVALIAAAPLTYPGPLQTYAGFTPLYALMDDAFAQQQFTAPTLALARALAALGAAPLDAWKLLDALAFLLGALGMFALARGLYGSDAGLAASALYSLLPYRLMTTYVRGAHDEALFLALLPWLALPLALLLARGATWRTSLPLFALAVGAALVLWKLLVPSAPDDARTQVYLFQLFSARWDYGTRGDWLDAPPLQLGLAPVGLSVIALTLKPTRGTLVLGAAAALLALLSITPIAQAWPWQLLFSAPWQLLGIAGFLLALVGGSLVARHTRWRTLPTLAAMLMLTLLASYSALEPRGLDYTPVRPPLARFAEQAYLIEASAPTLQAGTTISLTLLWQPINPFNENDKLFVHVIDAQDKIWAQRDTPPLNGARPTSTWQRGELLRDVVTLSIPADAPRGLRLALGLYNEATGARLPTGRGDRVIIEPP